MWSKKQWSSFCCLCGAKFVPKYKLKNVLPDFMSARRLRWHQKSTNAYSGHSWTRRAELENPFAADSYFHGGLWFSWTEPFVGVKRAHTTRANTFWSLNTHSDLPNASASFLSNIFTYGHITARKDQGIQAVFLLSLTDILYCSTKPLDLWLKTSFLKGSWFGDATFSATNRSETHWDGGAAFKSWPQSLFEESVVARQYSWMWIKCSLKHRF